MSAVSEVAERIRVRIAGGVSRCIAKQEALLIGLCASCHSAQDLVDFLLDRNLARELSLLKLSEIAITAREFDALFAGFRPMCVEPAVQALRGEALKSFVTQFQKQLECTLIESDQKAVWSLPQVRVLVYFALHTEMDTEERVACALGGVVRADLRRLEDLRASLESENDVYSVAASIRALVDCF